MKRRLVFAALALVTLAVGVVLVLLAGDVRRADDAFASGDAQYILAPASTPTWRADPTLPFRLGERLLGIGGEISLRQAIELYRAGRVTALGFDNGFAATQARGQAEAALGEIERSDSDAGRASQAANMLGVLAYIDARPIGGNAPAPIERAIAEFQSAVRLDSRNEDAKFNLELLLRLLQTGRLRTSSVTSSSGLGPERQGASQSPPGHGY